MANEWKPFPPPGVGEYEVRDHNNEIGFVVSVTKNSKGKLKCFGMYAATTMVGVIRGRPMYEWRLPGKTETNEVKQ